MQLANRMSLFAPPATLVINAKALELKAKGVNVLSLAVGEPDFPTPAHIAEATKKALDEGFTRYTATGGIPQLRQAVADDMKRRRNLDIEKDNVIVTNGGKQALFELMQALLNEGDEVLIPVPYWLSYPAMAVMAGGVSVFVDTTADVGFKVTPADLEAKRTAKTRLLILNAPSNPTGACYTRAEFNAIMDWALENGLFVISDEVYDQLVYTDEEIPSAAPYFARCPEQVAIVNALSKSYCMTGWRVGYTIADPTLIKAMEKLQGQATSNVCSIAQKGALAALTGPQDSIAEMAAAFKRRRDMALAEIATWKGVKCPKPEGAFYLFLDMNGVPGCSDDVAVCAKLLEEAHVAVVPGVSFGMKGCMRMSYAVSDETLMDALNRIRKVLYNN